MNLNFERSEIRRRPSSVGGNERMRRQFRVVGSRRRRGRRKTEGVLTSFLDFLAGAASTGAAAAAALAFFSFLGVAATGSGAAAAFLDFLVGGGGGGARGAQEIELRSWSVRASQQPCDLVTDGLMG